MAYNGNSAMDAHKYYGGSGTFADRRKTWVDLGLGDASTYQGTAAQNGQLISAMNSYGGLTRPAAQTPATQTPAAQTATPAPVSNTTSSPAAGSAPSSSSGQSSVAALRSNSDALQQQLAALVPYDNSQLMSITQKYANQRGALGPYDDSAAQNIYQAYLAQRNANPYDSTALQRIYDSYLAQRNAMGPFQYNYASDPVYQAYAAQYQRDGRRAMEDTLAQVAARTGGLASSYAGAAAQQQYDRYMTELNNVIPQLEQIAYSRYRDARSDLDKDLSTQLALENALYGRDRDRLSDLDTDLSRQLALEGLAYDRYRNRLGDLDSDYKTQLALEEVFYNRDRDLRSDMAKDLSTARSLEQTEYKNLEDLITTSGYVPTDSELSAAGMTRERANALKGVYDVAQQAAAAKANSSGSSSGSGSSSSKSASEEKGYGSDYTNVKNTIKGMSGTNQQKLEKLRSLVDVGARITRLGAEALVAELGLGGNDNETSERVALTETEQFLKNNPAKFLEMFGVKRFREVYGKQADAYLKQLNA